MKIKHFSENQYNKKSIVDNTPAFGNNRIKCDFKNLTHNNCACCGKKVMPASSINDFWTDVTAPFIENLSHNSFMAIRKKVPDLWNFLYKLAISYPKDSFAQITKDTERYQELGALLKELSENGKLIYYNEDEKPSPRESNIGNIIKKEFSRIQNCSRHKLKSTAEVVDRMSEFEPNLSEFGAKIYNELKNLSKRYGQHTLVDMLRLPNVNQHYQTELLFDIANYVEKRDICLERVKNIITNEKPNAEKDIINTLQPQVHVLFRETTDNKITIDIAEFMHKLKAIYSEYLRANNLEHIEEKVFEELDNFPTESLIPSSHYLANIGKKYNDSLVIDPVVRSNLATLKHILPLDYNDEKYDMFDNTLIFCNDCTIKNSGKTINEILEYHPEMKKNLETQLNYLGQEILNGTFPLQFRTVPIDTAKNIEKSTNGEYVPNVSIYAKNALENSAKLSKGPNGELKFREQLLDYLYSLIK